MTDATEPATRVVESVSAKEARLIDQSLSMQASLRDWYRSLGTALVLTVLVLSVLGVAFAFAGGDEPVDLLGWSADRATWLGWLAVVTFCLSLVDLLVDPRARARTRAEAVRALGALKSEYRSAAADQSGESDERLSEKYRELVGRLPEIPNALFNPLKSAHLRKVEMSRILSANPGMGYWQARRKLRRRLR